MDKNIKNINKQLINFLNQNDILQLLPDCGWLDGGCYTLAIILQKWISKDYCTLYGITDGNGILHHILIKIDSYFIDGDGISEYYELKNRWINEECLKDITIHRIQLNESIELPLYENIIYTIIDKLNKTINAKTLLQALKVI